MKVKIIVYQCKSYIIAKGNVQALFRNKQKYNYTNYMQVRLMRLTSNMEYLIVPKGTKFMGSGKLGLNMQLPSSIAEHAIHHITVIIRMGGVLVRANESSKSSDQLNHAH